MKYFDMPFSGKKASSIAFGTGNVDFARKNECIELMDTFLENGGNVFDTANIYGKWLESGINESEQVIGQWLHEKIVREKSLSRDDIIISTKGGHPDFGNMKEHRMDLKNLSADLDESLKSLNLEYVDIFWLHRDAPLLPVEQILESLIKLKNSGKIKLFGFSNWKAGRVLNAIEILESKGEISGLFGVQNRWSLAAMNPGGSEDNTLEAMDLDEYNLLTEKKLFEMPYSAMGKGYFAKLKKSGKNKIPQNLLKYYDNKLNDSRFKALCDLSEKYNTPVSQLTLAFMFNHPFPVIPIFRASSKLQLFDALKSTEINLTDDDMEVLRQGVIY